MAFLDSKTGQFVTYLKSKASITAHVGSGDSARLYPDRAKQGVALPYIVYIQASGEQYLCHSTIHGLRETVLHVYCYAALDSIANDLAESVKDELESLQKTTIGDPTDGEVWVDMTLVDIPDGGTEEIPGSDAHKYWRRLVVVMVHSA